MSRYPKHSAGTRPSGRLRFLVKIVLCVIVLSWVPTVAQAAFSGAAKAPLTVGTHSIPAPDFASGFSRCSGNGRSMTVELTDIAPVDRATGYTVTLTAPSGQVTTNRVAASPRTTVITRSSNARGTYTLTIRANVGTWTGQNIQYPLTC